MFYQQTIRHDIDKHKENSRLTTSSKYLLQPDV